MSKLNILFALAVVGCGGTDQSANGVFPATGFVGRTLHVEVSGDATSWKDGATVDFGAGVTTANVTVASPTDLFVDVTIADSAAIGPHDVTVSSGGSVTLKQAFDVEPPAELKITGSSAQGGFPLFTLTNHDFDTPFDPTQDQNTGAFTNLTINGPSGVNFRINAATSYTVSGFIAIDLDAMPGAVSIQSGVTGAQTAFAVGNIDVPATTPTALTVGTAGSGMIAMPFDTAVFSLDAGSATELLRFSSTTTSATAVPIVNVLPSSGHWADAIAGGQTTTSYLPAGGQFIAIVYDNADAAGYSFSLTGKTQTFTAFTEASDIGQSTGAAVVGTLPYKLSATLVSAGDQDWIKIVTTAPAVIHIKTTGNDASVDTQIDLLDSNGTSDPDFGGPLDENVVDYDEEAITSDIFGDPVQVAAGTYYVAISAGAMYSGTHTGYTALVWTE